MENLVIDATFWQGRRVLITGHTGFKGSWASLLLGSLGAELHGLALPPEHPSDLFISAGVEQDIQNHIGDIRDLRQVRGAFAKADPEIVIHMAAQSLVRRSYSEPVETYATNVLGTVHVLEAARDARRLAAVVVVTSDKCYENTGSLWGYRETDTIGGHDPYSSSKGCAELVTAAYRRSFFHTPGCARIASARAGNVIGGGDWSADRLVPDAVRAFSAQRPLLIRNPGAIRPWQHVLDPVIGYTVLAERLAKNVDGSADCWNFGPLPQNDVSVERIAQDLVALWGANASWTHAGGEHLHEANHLTLDCTKSRSLLGWQPMISLEEALRLTVEWYQANLIERDLRTLSLRQIESVLGVTRSSQSWDTNAASTSRRA